MLAARLTSLPELAPILALTSLELSGFHMNLGKLTFGAAGDLVGKYVFMDFIKCGLCKHTLKDC